MRKELSSSALVRAITTLEDRQRQLVSTSPKDIERRKRQMEGLRAGLTNLSQRHKAQWEQEVRKKSQR